MKNWGEDMNESNRKYYIIDQLSYIIHTNAGRQLLHSWIYRSSSVILLFSLICLKCEGVSPVTFLNWAERCDTLL